MQLRHKLILGFAGVALLFGAVGMVSVNVGLNVLRDVLRASSIDLADQMTDILDTLTNIGLGIAVVLAILFILLGVYISNYLWNPLLKLRAAMNNIADGELETRIDIRGNNEISALAGAFNHMADELKKAKDTLDTSYEQYNAMLRAISDEMTLIDKDFNIIWSNTMSRQIHGEDMIGKKCYAVYHQRISPCEPYPCPTVKALYDNQVHQYEALNKDKNGEIRYLDCKANVALHDEQGRPEAVLEICRDITERRQMEDALRASERKCSDLVQNSPDGIISLDKTGHFLSFNAAIERMTGFSAREVLGRHFTKAGILADESIQKTLKEFGLLLSGAERSPFELVMTRKDKSLLVMEANARLIEQSDREAWVQLILRDITERKEAERALDRSENMLRTIINATQDAIIAINEDGTINLFNPAAEKMFGCGKQEMIGHTLDLLIPEQYRHCHQQHVKDYFAMYKQKRVNEGTVEVQAQHRDGHTFPIELSLSIGTIDSQPMVIAIARDITERKKAEQTLEELNSALETTNLDLIRTNKELQEFAYIAAHDLKTPLRAIGTLADWLAVDYADKFDEPGKENVSLLVAKAKQMGSLIDDILRYSGAGQNTQKSQEVDLNQVLQAMIEDVAPPKHIHVVVEDQLPTTKCKKTHIIQIFQNLISNAVKYMDKPEGRIAIRCTEQDNAWKFSVADNGPGIEEKYFEKIFKIFQTLKPCEGIESTGIGLSIVKKLVELNHGSVWVESEIGRGCTFFFTLPKSKQASVAYAK